jgi:hypothetical protein
MEHLEVCSTHSQMLLRMANGARAREKQWGKGLSVG